jgi:hypothetical protein
MASSCASAGSGATDISIVVTPSCLIQPDFDFVDMAVPRRM